MGKHRRFRSFGEVPKLTVNQQGKTQHHLVPRSRRGTDDPSNLVEVDPREHWLFHAFFQVMTPQEMCDKLNKWIDPRYQVVVIKRQRGG